MLLVPPALQAPPPVPPAVRRLHDLLGIPYREDAVLDEQGRWTTFAHPGRALASPGLNCSGFVVAAARRLLGFQGSPAEAARDRRGDSGPGAAFGRDWDFGWDLLLNLSEGWTRRWFAPGGASEVSETDAAEVHGFAVQDAALWRNLVLRMRPGCVYLAAFLRPRPGGAPPRYHHVALLLKEADGRVWLYQTLPGGRAHRLGISTSAGLDRLRAMFGSAERIRILEVAASP